MVNSTANGRKTGKGAGINEKTVITGMGAEITNSKELNARGKIFIQTSQLRAGEFISIKAYPGGKPNNKNKGDKEMIH